jgi:arsenite-transporting ATPase
MDLIDLAPPGLDELFAALALTDALLGNQPPYDLVVLDTAPTGHTLRLLAMPDAALEWVRAILAILLKYRQIVGLGELAQDLVDAARDLRALGALLRDPSRTRFVPVARAEDVVRLETERLVRALRRRGIPIAPLVVNAKRMTAESRACTRCLAVARAEKREIGLLRRTSRAMLLAPATHPPPRGPRELAAWGATWKST